MNMLETLQTVADEIGRRLGIRLDVVEKEKRGWYGRYQLRHRGKALINSWRNYETMALHLNTTMQILEAVERERQIQTIESERMAKENGV
jgi:2,3-bisphosphoglycerate-independent phosphoglycerate mutase